MATRVLELELPEEVIGLLGAPGEASAKATEAIVLELLREARISQGKAAELLGITRWEMLDLMAHHRIESGPATAEEMQQEIDAMRRFVGRS
jgi:predicted HTH domain antitoxin